MPGIRAAGLRAAQLVELAVRIAVVAQGQNRNTRQQRLVRAAGNRIAQGAVQQIRGLRIIEKRQQYRPPWRLRQDILPGR